MRAATTPASPMCWTTRHARRPLAAPSRTSSPTACSTAARRCTSSPASASPICPKAMCSVGKTRRGVRTDKRRNDMALTRQTLRDPPAMAYSVMRSRKGGHFPVGCFNLDSARGISGFLVRPDVSVESLQAHLNETWLVVTDEETEPAVVPLPCRPALTPLFVAFIQQYMEHSLRVYCVFEDALRGSGDGFLNNRREDPFAFHGDDVYYVLEHDIATPDTIAEGSSETHSAWIQNVFLTHISPDVEPLRPWTEITGWQMSALARNAEAMLVSAFDGVGYVVWSAITQISDDISRQRGVLNLRGGRAVATQGRVAHRG